MYISEISINNNTFSNETALGLLWRAGDKLPHAGRRIVASFEPVSCTVALVALELCFVITDIEHKIKLHLEWLSYLLHL